MSCKKGVRARDVRAQTTVPTFRHIEESELRAPFLRMQCLPTNSIRLPHSTTFI
jgi:hypothetical protein